ncbi:Holliday junction branch migration protein RuvA, partial [Candidatus Roizmanbacteria bacterium CG10_big_fil_rev_8_21_14_0_10_39_6]
MIGKLRGTVGEILDKSLIVDTEGGVGYAVRIAEPVLLGLERDTPIELYTHMHVREQELSLYGFLTKEELRIFTILIDISSIGPKSAMNI